MSRGPTSGAVLIVVILVAGLVVGCAGEQTDRCAMCSKILPATGGVTLVSAEGQAAHVCCARCTFLYVKRAEAAGSSFTHMQTRDYETGEPLELTEAFFVYGSSTVPCCVPSVLAVGSRQSADDLAAHGGGKVGDYGELRAMVALEANGE
jgi:nitrous oxide reductase accessory protein NosL